MGLPIAFAVGALISVAGSIFRGGSERKQARRNARYTREMGRQNAANAIAAAQLNSSMGLLSAGVNAALARTASVGQAALMLKEAQFNAAIQFTVGEYNARLIEREEKLLWQEHDLNEYIYKRKIDQDVSTILTSYAGAGIELGNVGEAPEMKVLSTQTEGGIQLSIMRYGAEIEAFKLLEAAAQSRWMATVEANKIIYQGKMTAAGTLMQGEIAAFGYQTQGMMNAAATTLQGKITSDAILYEANLAANNGIALGNQAWMNGLFGAFESTARSYLGYRTAMYTPGGTGPTA